mgnify:FL=1
MAIRQVRTIGDDILRKECKPVKEITPRIAELIEDMFETMYEANGVGLAAPQVGIPKRLFIMDLGLPQMIEAINPQILKVSGKQHVVEGCLSCPDTWGYVDRPKRCRMRAQNRKGEWYEMAFADLGAQCACHENDHLDGHLFVDIVTEFVEPDEEEE